MTNAIEVLGVADHEDVITNLLRCGLERAPAFRQVFLNLMANQVPANIRQVTAYTRKQVPEAGVPDLSIILVGHQVIVWIIENKIGAEEGKDQTARYARPDFFTALRPKLNLVGPAKPAYLYLTLFPAPGPESQEFHHATYRDLLHYLQADRSTDDPVVAQLLVDFLGLVRDFYAAGEWQPDAPVTGLLRSTDLLGGSYLCFVELMRRVAPVGGLECCSCTRSRGSGRYDYFAEFSKRSWHPAAFNPKSRPIHFNPSRHVQLHFQPQFQVLNGKLNLYLHYHTNPYLPETEARQRLPPANLARYEAIRKAFQDDLRSASVPGLAIGGRWNQIGKYPMNLQGLTADVLIGQMRVAMSRAEPVLDELVSRYFVG